MWFLAIWYIDDCVVESHLFDVMPTIDDLECFRWCGGVDVRVYRMEWLSLISTVNFNF